MKKIVITELIPCYRSEDRCKECRLAQAVITMPNGIGENAKALLDEVLNPAGELYGKELNVINGFCCPVRCRNLGCNQADYVRGDAADISAVGLQGDDLALENLVIARAIVQNGKWDVLILDDVPSTGIEPSRIHVSWKRNGGNRKEILKRVKGSKDYQKLSKLDMAQLMSE